MPRCTSPRASERTLPCSSVISSASSATWSRTSSRKAKSTLVRLLSEACDHSSNAVRPLRTASSTSLVLPSTTRETCSPVAGFQIGARRADVPEVVVPPIQCSMVLTAEVLAFGTSPWVSGGDGGRRRCCTLDRGARVAWPRRGAVEAGMNSGSCGEIHIE